MRTRVTGQHSQGFTLLELMIVVVIIAMATAGVSVALRDSADTALEREAQRLASLLESARARSRTAGMMVLWKPTATGFGFEGLPANSLPTGWLTPGISPGGAALLVLGPEPIIDRQAITLSLGLKTMRIATDGVRPFSVDAVTP